MGAAILFCVLIVSGCATTSRVSRSSKQVVADLSAQAAQVRSVRARAWVSTKTPKQKISFPAIVVIERSSGSKPSLRIEAIDVVGVTHALIVMREGNQLSWVDYDWKVIYEIFGAWNGIPLSELADLLIGVAPLGSERFKSGSVGPVTQDQFVVKSVGAQSKFGLKWIDPGPRVALMELNSEFDRGGRAEGFTVRYDQFGDWKDFYLPARTTIVGKGKDGTIEIELSWRERKWNDVVESKLFDLPSRGLEKFDRERL